MLDDFVFGVEDLIPSAAPYSEGGDIQLEFLPPYAPELNPVEYLWAHWKQREMPNFCPKDKAGASMKMNGSSQAR